MKLNKSILSIIVGLMAFFSTSCTDYLDKSPESGLTEAEVFGRFSNYKLYFNSIFYGTFIKETSKNFNVWKGYPMGIELWDQRFLIDGTTELSDLGKTEWGLSWKQGILGQSWVYVLTYDMARRPILGSMLNVTRVCNITLEKADMVQDGTVEDMADIKGQAYFFRGFCSFTMQRFWGPMPYLTKSLTGDDEWDLPRPTKVQGYLNCAADFDLAYEQFEIAKKIRRDPMPGESGHLNDSDQDKPNGVAAKAFKGRMLLYAASPLNNEDNNVQLWSDAAVANWEAIVIAKQYGYALMDSAHYMDNFYGVQYCNEQIWAECFGTKSYGATDMQTTLTYVMSNNRKASGACPTQNLVDKFETIYGDPLNTEADRAAAEAKGHYMEQNPYVNRDPRFGKFIIYNGAPIHWTTDITTAQLYKGGVHLDEKQTLGKANTGYMCRKRVDDMSIKNPTPISITDPLIRLTEVYLNYAEAANEAYGPNTPAPGSDMTAVQAVNLIRNRIGMPDVQSQFTTSTEAFRERIKNERTIEFCYEGIHHYNDIRRWKDAPVAMGGPLYGIYIEPVEVSAEYPIGYKHTRVLLPETHQSRWMDYMYYLPFLDDTYNLMRNFDLTMNPRW